MPRLGFIAIIKTIHYLFFMKVKKILTLAFVAVLMASCGNEDGPGGDGGGNGGTEHTVYFGVNMSGAEFGNVYPGVDGTHYGYPTKKDL